MLYTVKNPLNVSVVNIDNWINIDIHIFIGSRNKRESSFVVVVVVVLVATMNE